MFFCLFWFILVSLISLISAGRLHGRSNYFLGFLAYLFCQKVSRCFLACMVCEMGRFEILSRRSAAYMCMVSESLLSLVASYENFS